MASVQIKNFADGGNQATEVVPRRKGRLFGIVQNVSDVDIAVGFSNKTTYGPGEHAGFVLKPNASISLPELPSNLAANEIAIYAIHNSTGDKEVRWIELPTRA